MTGDAATTVRWHSTTAADAALRRHAAEVFGPGEVTIGRHCPTCGSDAHGRPWLRHPATEAVWVSLSRTGDHLVTALSTAGPIGVDLEVIAAVASRWSPDVILAPGERAATPDQRAWIWVAKEAVLKRRGTGLATPMPEVHLAGESGLRAIPAPPGLIAAMADSPDPHRA